MIDRPLIQGVPDFWNRLDRSSYRFLGLDYDGTLAPFRLDRMAAKPLSGVKELIRKIKRETFVAVISGRPLSEVLELLGVSGVTIVGSHGFEVRDDSGSTKQYTPDQPAALALQEARKAAVEAGHGDRLEPKIASLGLHTRGMDRQAAGRLESSIEKHWTAIVKDAPLEVRRFNGGVEIRSCHRDKGVALAELLSAQPTGCFCAYLGDDDTDEDAFKALGTSGIGIKVGPPGDRTLAQGRLANPEQVRLFLAAWAESNLK